MYFGNIMYLSLIHISAKQLGMKTIWIKQGFGSLWTVMEESEKADIEVNNLSDILNYL